MGANGGGTTMGDRRHTSETRSTSSSPYYYPYLSFSSPPSSRPPPPSSLSSPAIDTNTLLGLSMASAALNSSPGQAASLLTLTQSSAPQGGDVSRSRGSDHRRRVDGNHKKERHHQGPLGPSLYQAHLVQYLHGLHHRVFSLDEAIKRERELLRRRERERPWTLYYNYHYQQQQHDYRSAEASAAAPETTMKSSGEHPHPHSHHGAQRHPCENAPSSSAASQAPGNTNPHHAEHPNTAHAQDHHLLPLAPSPLQLWWEWWKSSTRLLSAHGGQEVVGLGLWQFHSASSLGIHPRLTPTAPTPPMLAAHLEWFLAACWVTRMLWAPPLLCLIYLLGISYPRYEVDLLHMVLHEYVKKKEERKNIHQAESKDA